MPLDPPPPPQRLAPLCSLRLLWKYDLRPMQMYGEHEKNVHSYSRLIRGWALINFSYLQDGRLFEVGA